MKNIYKFTLLIVVILFSITSCTDEETFRNPVHYKLEKTGAFPKFVNPIETAVGVDLISNLEYSFSVYDPNNSIKSYDLKIYAVIGGTQTAVKDVSVTTSFPSDFNFSIQEMADILEVSVDDFSFGDSIGFVGSCISKSGIFYDATTNTENTLNAPGYNSAFGFAFTILCPGEVMPQDLEGVWTITLDDFGVVLDNGVFQVIQGPDANQITLIDPFGHVNLATGNSFNVVMDITGPSAGHIEVQDSWDSGAYGLTYGIGRIAGDGTIFKCVGNGFMTFEFNYTVDAGSFGSFAMEFTKQ